MKMNKNRLAGFLLLCFYCRRLFIFILSNSKWITTADDIAYKANDPEIEKFEFTISRSGFQLTLNDRPTNDLRYFQLLFTDELC